MTKGQIELTGKKISWTSGALILPKEIIKEQIYQQEKKKTNKVGKEKNNIMKRRGKNEKNAEQKQLSYANIRHRKFDLTSGLFCAKNSNTYSNNNDNTRVGIICLFVCLYLCLFLKKISIFCFNWLIPPAGVVKSFHFTNFICVYTLHVLRYIFTLVIFFYFFIFFANTFCVGVKWG